MTMTDQELAHEMQRADAHRSALPPESPLAMPSRPVRGEAARVPLERANLHERLARWTAFGGAVLLTACATTVLWGAIAGTAPGPLPLVLTALFAVTFGWIAFSCTSVAAGVLFYRRRPVAGGELLRKTALVMPVYNEDPSAPMASLLAMAEGLARLGAADRFEIFVASDTQRAGAWLRETEAVAALRDALASVMPVWYRRRDRNIARKSGNVEEFVRRFGGRYDAMIMLDADSVVAPETLVALSRSLAGDEALGLLQTAPSLTGANGFLPRLQQFASAIYGSAIARGVAAWQGPDGNYWGHNAIIRMSAFADACGLPELPGRRPFGGPILSHDFAEAAWMRRAGWSVRMDPDLAGSHEEAPPTLLDLAQRDRRWMQGNFQHAGLLFASGLSPVSRFHLLGGILGYLMSPLWLALMVVGGWVAAHSALAAPTYFGVTFQLAPSWPQANSAAVLALFVLSMSMLVLPKAVGLVGALGQGWKRGDAGEVARLLSSATIELLASALYAPVCMAIQTRHCAEIFLGRDSGWRVQTRVGAATPWGECIRRHAGHTLSGALVAAAAARYLPNMLGWLAPTLAGLLLAIPISRLSGSAGLGEWLRSRGLLMTKEERDSSPVLRAHAQRTRAFERSLTGLGSLRAFVLRASHRDRHFAMAGGRVESRRGEPRVAALTARAKLMDARTFDEFEVWITAEEELAILMDRALGERVSNLAVSPRQPQRIPGISAVGTRSRHALPPLA